jgi:hypothetical protein
MGNGDQLHARAAFTPGDTRYPLYGRLGGPQDRSGRMQKISPPTGIQSPDRPARSESRYRPRYPGPPYNRQVRMSHQLVAEAATRTTHNKHKRRKSGARTHDLICQGAADLRLCPHCHRNWPILILFSHVGLYIRTLQFILPLRVQTLRMHVIAPIRSICTVHPRFNNHNIHRINPLIIIKFSRASSYVFSLGFS